MKENNLSDKQREVIKNFVETYQKPVQFQIMALIETLKFQRLSIPKEAWKPYIKSFCDLMEKDLKELQEQE